MRRINKAAASGLFLFLIVIVCTVVFGLQTSVAAGAATATATAAANSTVRIHYIDVGQADSILIQSGASSMLIDAGNREDDKTVIAYLEMLRVKKLDYVIGTHPHEDHIGGLASVLDHFKVSKIIMPKVTTNTKTFENLLTTIKRKGLKITAPIAATTFALGQANVRILAPGKSAYDDLNNYSVVLRLSFGNNAFLFQGDAETPVEQEILKKGYALKADVIKLGHHGSNSSSTAAYLDQVKPAYAIISCGKDNDYGHPHKQIMDRLQAKKIKYFRTYLNGTIVCSSNGKTISFTLGNGTIQKASGISSTSSTTDKQAATLVYVTKSGSKYHLSSCSSISSSRIELTLQNAKGRGYLPCSICNPPN